MNWKEKLNEYEKNKKWVEAIRLLEQVIETEDCESEPVVRIIYLLHNLLVEEDYESSGLGHDFLASLLLKAFSRIATQIWRGGGVSFFYWCHSPYCRVVFWAR